MTPPVTAPPPKADKTALCRALWGERPGATAKEIADLVGQRLGEPCSILTAQKAKPLPLKKPGREKSAAAGAVTADDLRAVKELAGGGTGLFEFAATVARVEVAAERVGGLARLREAVQVLQELVATASPPGRTGLSG